MQSRSLHFLPRALTVLAAVLATVLGATVQADTARAGETSASGLTGLTFTSVNSGRNLDVQNGNTGNGVFLVTNSAPGYHQEWNVNQQTDGSFTLSNADTGKCMETGLPMRQQTCGGATAQRWYFQPVTGVRNAFMIRNAGDNRCLDVVLAAQNDDAWTQTYNCNGSRAQQWAIPATATGDAFAAAVDHASKRCQKDSATCSWTKGTQAPAEPLPTECVSPVWFNGTGAAVPWTFSLSTTSGWSSEISVSFESSVTVGEPSPVQTKLGLTTTGKVTYSLSETLGNSLTITVPPQHYGWVALSALATKVTGEWTFDAGGYPWTAHDTVTVPLTSDDQGHASVYLAKTDTEFATCGG
ncbi:RICIN domain-containing protein [Streptomyces sp. NPDC059166]|uniref:RICIN domain-containing protein n=1 Tax=Streptomyces sp. NPDC059166 TaxID=3346752 RepID=UPI0036A24C85